MSAMDKARSAGSLVIGAAIGLGGVLLLGAVGFFGYVYVQEEVYPWQDMSSYLGTIHVENESAAPVRAEWKWSDWADIPWQSFHGHFQSGAEVESKQIGSWMVMPAAGPVDLRLLTADGAEFEIDRLPFVADGHLLLRLDEDGACWYANGGETWLGAPDWCAERPVPRTH